MAIPARTCCFALILVAMLLNVAQSETVRGSKQARYELNLCEVPVTKAYNIRSEFCPQQVAALIRQNVPCDSSNGCCGPFGVPPIFTAGSSVVVRQSRETHQQIARFLSDMNVTVPKTIGTP